jgi:hypothetical protein
MNIDHAFGLFMHNITHEPTTDELVLDEKTRRDKVEFLCAGLHDIYDRVNKSDKESEEASRVKDETRAELCKCYTDARTNAAFHPDRILLVAPIDARLLDVWRDSVPTDAMLDGHEQAGKIAAAEFNAPPNQMAIPDSPTTQAEQQQIAAIEALEGYDIARQQSETAYTMAHTTWLAASTLLLAESTTMAEIKGTYNNAFFKWRVASNGAAKNASHIAHHSPQ